MVQLLPDQLLTFPLTAPWQFWQRRTAAAQVITVDDGWGIVHLRVAAAGRCFIAHLPIVERYALLGTRILERASAPTTTMGHEALSGVAVAAWRAVRHRGEAGAFAVPLRHAIALIYETASDPSDEAYIESAYPVADGTGAYRIVRVITPPAG